MDKKLTLIMESLINENTTEAERLLHDLIVELAKKINSGLEAQDSADNLADMELADTDVPAMDAPELSFNESEEFDGVDVDADVDGEEGDIDVDGDVDVDGEGEEVDTIDSFDDVAERFDDIDAQIAALQAELDGFAGEEGVEGDVDAEMDADGEFGDDVDGDLDIADDEVFEGKSFRNDGEDEFDARSRRKADADHRRGRKSAFDDAEYDRVEESDSYYPELDDMDTNVESDFDEIDLEDFDFNDKFDEASDLLKKVKAPKNNGNELVGDGGSAKKVSQKAPVIQADKVKSDAKPIVSKEGGKGNQVKTSGIKRVMKGKSQNDVQPLKPVKAPAKK